jgi:hypothetical protein
MYYLNSDRRDTKRSHTCIIATQIIDNMNEFELKGFRIEILRPFVKTGFCCNIPEYH